ncbi:MAG: hypothetical protein LUI87_18895 [Lachnospiraceae bacterium]|nr:hypothetical protein [Lachnospiraceae bacterium]
MRDIIFEIQDMRWLDWAVRKISPGTPGCFLKAYEENDGKRVYYKLSNYDSYRGVFGHECVNELIVSRTMDILGISHVPYRLIHARITVDGKEIETWISASDNFRRENEEKLAYDLFYDLQKKETESPLDFAIRNRWELSIYQMFVIDYLVANRDRHGSNLEVLRNQEDGTIRLAPLFDQGVSLLFSTYGDEKLIENTDVMREFAVNNYIGSRSLEYNLSLIPKQFDLRLNSLKESDRESILGGTEKILSENHRHKLWEMIWKRWCYFETVRNKKESL